MSEIRWKHNFFFTYDRGKVKVTCKPCGKSSPWFDRMAEDTAMKEWCNSHSGLRLKGERSDAPPA